MKKATKTTVRTIFEMAVLAVLIYYSWPTLERAAGELLDAYFPCRRPVTYRLDIFDERFGLRRDDFLSAALQAESIWEEPLKRQLFYYADDGRIRLNLIYDYRQEATDTLRQMGLVIKEDKATYDQLKAQYNSLDASYKRDKAEYEAAVSDLEAKKAEYEQEVARWNQRGGAPPKTYERLAQEKAALEARVGELRAMASRINVTVDSINATVTVLNKLIGQLNLSADAFNSVIQERGKEFQQGLYKDSGAGDEIDIYEFEDRQQLVRVLAHEFGHALGLEHADDPLSIMYKYNSGQNETLSSHDIAALQGRCRGR